MNKAPVVIYSHMAPNQATVDTGHYECVPVHGRL